MASKFSTPSRFNLRDVAAATTQTRLVPGQQEMPVPQTAKPMQPAPPAADVPAPAPTMFETPAPKNLGSMKTPKDLKTVSEALADGLAQMNGTVEATPRPMTPGQMSKDLKEVSMGINETAEEGDATGED